jgi:hypothetical protein
VVSPDVFLRAHLSGFPELVVSAVKGMTARLKRPPMSVLEIADHLAAGAFAPRFGAELGDLLRELADASS